jgi:hypothetical protein
MKKGALILSLLFACLWGGAQHVPRFGVAVDDRIWTQESAEVFSLDCRLAGFQFVSYPEGSDSPVLKLALLKRGINCLSDASWKGNERQDIPEVSLAYDWVLEYPDFADWQEAVSILCEVVAKNGCLIYDVSVDDEGHFAGDDKEVLPKVGAWLFPNGKALFESVPTQRYEYKLSRDTSNDLYAQAFFTESPDGKTLYAFFSPIDFKAFDAFYWLGNVPKGKMTFLGSGTEVSYRIGRVRDAKISRVEVILPSNVPIAPMVFEFRKK